MRAHCATTSRNSRSTIADGVAAQLEADGGAVKRDLGSAQPGLPDQEEPEGPLHAARPRRTAGLRHRDGAPASPERGRAAPTIVRRSRRRRPPSCRVVAPTTASAPSVDRSRPGALNLDDAAAGGREEYRARDERRDGFASDWRSRADVRYHRRQSRRPPRGPAGRSTAAASPAPLLRPERAENRLQGRACCRGSCRSAARSSPAFITAVLLKKRRELFVAIKRARFLGLLPYVLTLRNAP